MNTDGLFSRISVEPAKQKIIFEDFEENGTLSLKNIFEKFNGEISYNELHLLRLVYLCNHKK